jgi:hypothetical protein
MKQSSKTVCYKSIFYLFNKVFALFTVLALYSQVTDTCLYFMFTGDKLFYSLYVHGY